MEHPLSAFGQRDYYYPSMNCVASLLVHSRRTFWLPRSSRVRSRKIALGGLHPSLLLLLLFSFAIIFFFFPASWVPDNDYRLLAGYTKPLNKEGKVSELFNVRKTVGCTTFIFLFFALSLSLLSPPSSDLYVWLPDTEWIWLGWRLVLLFPGIRRFFKGAPSIGVRRAVPACSLRMIRMFSMQLGFFEWQIRDGGKEIDDAVPMSTATCISPSVRFAGQAPCLPWQKNKTDAVKNFFLSLFFFYYFIFSSCTKPFWGCWIYDPQFIWLPASHTYSLKSFWEKRKGKSSHKFPIDFWLYCYLSTLLYLFGFLCLQNNVFRSHTRL